MDVLTNRARVAMNDGVPFGRMGEGFARLNIGCPRSQLEEGLDRIADAFDKL
jgi:cystathionine beta-lyase